MEASDARRALERIYSAAIDAASPERLVADALEGRCSGAADLPKIIGEAPRLMLVAAGKASLGMARPILANFASRISAALAIVPEGMLASKPDPLEVCVGSHPIPDDRSERAASAALATVARAQSGGLVVVALSGGASAL